MPVREGVESIVNPLDLCVTEVAIRLKEWDREFIIE
jgi:electron transfer flavoprotein alpha/beta subunit